MYLLPMSNLFSLLLSGIIGPLKSLVQLHQPFSFFSMPFQVKCKICCHATLAIFTFLNSIPLKTFWMDINRSNRGYYEYLCLLETKILIFSLSTPLGNFWQLSNFLQFLTIIDQLCIVRVPNTWTR